MLIFKPKRHSGDGSSARPEKPEVPSVPPRERVLGARMTVDEGDDRAWERGVEQQQHSEQDVAELERGGSGSERIRRKPREWEQAISVNRPSRSKSDSAASQAPSGTSGSSLVLDSGRKTPLGPAFDVDPAVVVANAEDSNGVPKGSDGERVWKVDGDEVALVDIPGTQSSTSSAGSVDVERRDPLSTAGSESTSIIRSRIMGRRRYDAVMGS